MELAIVNPAEWIPKCRDLIEAHWEEVAFGYPFNPNIAGYQQLFDAGAAFGVRAAVSDETVGYCSVMVVPSMHNPEMVMGLSDAIFVRPSYRRGLVTGRLVAASEQEAKRRGALRFSWAGHAGTDFSKMLARRGYVGLDEVVIREI